MLLALDKTWLSSLKLSSSTWQMSKVRMYVTFLRSTLRDATVPMDVALRLRVRGAFAGLWEEKKKQGVFGKAFSSYTINRPLLSYSLKNPASR